MATIILPVAVIALTFFPTCVLSDRDSSQQEEYYLKNFKNNPNKNRGSFVFLRNDRDSKKNRQGAGRVDVVPENPYGEREDNTIPKLLLFVPLVGAWMAALVLVREVSPRVISIVSMSCRHISEFTRRMSERTASMQEKNRLHISRLKRMSSSSKRKERTQELASSEQSISPSLIDIANMDSDNEFDNSGEFNSSGTSLFSSFRRAKTVVASNSKHKKHNHNNTILREPSPARGSPSKHKHATRLRRPMDEKYDIEGRYETHGDHSRHHRTHEIEYNKHDKHRHEHKSEICHESSGRIGHHVKAKSSRGQDDDHLSPLEKKLSNGSPRRHRR
jgi:hypothetical protein